jgi:hypothetical protein
MEVAGGLPLECQLVDINNLTLFCISKWQQKATGQFPWENMKTTTSSVATHLPAQNSHAVIETTKQQISGQLWVEISSKPICKQ